MVLVGDLFQLPPVVTPRDADVITQRYASPHFFAAHCLKGQKFFPVELLEWTLRDQTLSLSAPSGRGEGRGEVREKHNQLDDLPP